LTRVLKGEMRAGPLSTIDFKATRFVLKREKSWWCCCCWVRARLADRQTGDGESGAGRPRGAAAGCAPVWYTDDNAPWIMNHESLEIRMRAYLNYDLHGGDVVCLSEYFPLDNLPRGVDTILRISVTKLKPLLRRPSCIASCELGGFNILEDFSFGLLREGEGKVADKPLKFGATVTRLLAAHG
jgi:hypothetical protein